MNQENIHSNASSDSDEISLKELILKIQGWWKYLLSKWLIIISFGILGGIFGFIYAYIKKPSYIAVTTFVLEESNSGAGALGNLGGLASMVGIDVGGGGGIFQGDNILELYKSRSMIEKTLLTETNYNGKSELLIDRYIAFNELRKSWAKKVELRNIQFKSSASNREFTKLTRLQDSVLAIVVLDINKNYLNVSKLDKKLSIIKAQVKAPDEIFAKVFNDQIVKNVNDFYLQTKTKKSLENVSILQQKTDSVRAVMNGAIYSAATVADATPNLNPTRQVQRIAPMQKSQFAAETNKSILGELVKNLEMSKISLRKETPLIQVVDKPIFPLEVDKLGKAKACILGALLLGFLTVIFLSIKLVFKNILSSE